MTEFEHKIAVLRQHHEELLSRQNEPVEWGNGIYDKYKYPISYFLVWRNYKEEWFGPSPAKPDAPYFNEMYDKENVLFLNEIK